MIERVCDAIHNYFTRRNNRQYDRWSGTFTITDGVLELDLQPGNYFLIRGSDFNDGVHIYPADDLTDETFTGTIYKMVPPKAFLTLVDEISAWETKYGSAVNSPFQSESFAGYSYTKKGGSNADGTDSTASWQSTFASSLSQWRKLYEHL